MSRTTPSPSSPPPSAAERVYSHVKSQILSGDLPGATMLSEGEIAAAIGVSRTPVREAFLRLQTEGWLTLYPKRGALVQPVAPGEGADVLDARRMVELHAATTLCALQAAEREHRLLPLTEVLAAQQTAIDASDLAAYSRSDARFHQQIVALAGNDLITAFYVGIRERQERLVAHTVRQDLDRARSFVADHARMHKHLASGDLSAFTAALDAHLAVSRESLA